MSFVKVGVVKAILRIQGVNKICIFSTFSSDLEKKSVQEVIIRFGLIIVS